MPIRTIFVPIFLCLISIAFVVHADRIFAPDTNCLPFAMPVYFPASNPAFPGLYKQDFLHLFRKPFGLRPDEFVIGDTLVVGYRNAARGGDRDLRSVSYQLKTCLYYNR
jgi:hypothetical protein